MIDEYRGHYVIIGPPGTGKTTMIARQVRAIMEKAANSGYWLQGECPVLVLSLTRAAAAEAAGRDMKLPREAVGTLHAMCYRALGFPRLITRAHLDQWNRLNPHYSIFMDPFEPVSEMTEMPEGYGSTVMMEYDRMRHAMVGRDRWPNHVLTFATAWESWKKTEGIIDFTDMIANAPERPPMGARIIICDEAQDLSALETRVIQRWSSDGALIAVGDPWQSLYAWRGADPSWLTAALDDPQRCRVLSQSYRVPKAVHRAATRWATRLSDYKPIEYQPKDETGHCLHRPNIVLSLPYTVVNELPPLLQRGDTVMIAATCEYMIRGVVSELRDRGLPFANPWRLANRAWNPLKTSSAHGRKRSDGEQLTTADRLRLFLRPPIEENRTWTVGETLPWIERIKSAGTLYYGSKIAIQRLCVQDPQVPVDFEFFSRYMETAALSELWRAAFEERDPIKMIQWMSQRLSSVGSWHQLHRYMERMIRAGHKPWEEPRLFIGTIHSFKGAEADHVYLFPDISAAARESWELGHPQEKDAIVRAFYVGMTRARKSLTLCGGGRIAVDWGDIWRE